MRDNLRNAVDFLVTPNLFSISGMISVGFGVELHYYGETIVAKITHSKIFYEKITYAPGEVIYREGDASGKGLFDQVRAHQYRRHLS